MKAWDSWVKYYKAGGGGSWPRDAFESLLDYFEERMSQVSDKSSGWNGTPVLEGIEYNLEYIDFETIRLSRS